MIDSIAGKYQDAIVRFSLDWHNYHNPLLLSHRIRIAALK